MDLIASLQCEDQPGIVHAMTTAVLNCGGNIIENQQFTDPTTNQFVMRTRFETSQGIDGAHKSLNEGLSKFNPSLHIRQTAQKPRALVMVTTESHCLRDLLYLEELGELNVEIPLVISNREELRSLVESHGVKFLFLPVTADTKASQEAEILKQIQVLKIDFVVLESCFSCAPSVSSDNTQCQNWHSKPHLSHRHHCQLPCFCRLVCNIACVSQLPALWL